MRFIDPSTYVSSWNDTAGQNLVITGAQTTVVSGGYTIYTFTTGGVNPITISGSGVADILFVGGGGGAAALGGGGGGGGYVFRYNARIDGQRSTSNPAPTNTHIQVGLGGHGPTNNSHGPIGGAGSPSKLVVDGVTVIEAIGGGGGGAWNNQGQDFQQTGAYLPTYGGGTVGNNLYLGAHTPQSLNPANPFPSQYGPGHAGGRGGSGGGGSGQNQPGGSSVLGQGHPGGYGHHPNHYKGGGGGGAGERGMDTNPGWPGGLQHHNGVGGDGLSNDISGTMMHYAGGGGGSGHHPTVHTGGGGLGGGTTAGTHSPDHGNLAPGTGALPGSGGGAGGGQNPEAQGRGGPGIVIIRVNNRYNTPQYTRMGTNI